MGYPGTGGRWVRLLAVAGFLVGAPAAESATSGPAASRPAVQVALASLDRDAVVASGTVGVTLRAPRNGRVLVRLALRDAAGRTLTSSRTYNVRLRRGRARRLTLPIGNAIASALTRCSGTTLAARVAPRRGTPLRSGQGTASLPLVPPACGRLFADDSPWNRPPPADAPLDPASDTLTAELLRQVQADAAAGHGPWINTTRFSVPLYTVLAGQPTVPVGLDRNAHGDVALARALERVPLPPAARPSPDSDSELVVWQPATDTLWEFWGLRRDPDGQWHARWGGRIDHASSSPGYFQPPHASWGGSGSGFAIAGGLMTVSELRRGHIDHALAMAIPAVRSDAFALPASRTDGRAPGADRVPEGARFRLDPTLDLDQLGLPPATRMIAEAAQRYGIVVRDRAAAVVLYAEDPAPLGANPYPALFDGSARDVLRRFPWDRLQLLRMDLRPWNGNPIDVGCTLLLACP